MRAMMLEFPEDPACDTLDRQYMLGESLLVAPIFSEDGQVDYYLPAGRWTNFLSGQTVDGGRWVREQHGYLSLPLMVRPNSVIPVGANDQLTDYDYEQGVTLHVFELEDGADLNVPLPTAEGETSLLARICRSGRQVIVEMPNAGKPWSVLLRGYKTAQLVDETIDGIKIEPGELGVLVCPEDFTQVIKVVV